MTNPGSRRSSRQNKTSDAQAEDDPALGNGKVNAPTTPPKSTSSKSPPLSPLPSGDDVDPFIYEASDDDFNDWIRPLSEDNLSEVDFHQIIDDVQAMLDATHSLIKNKDKFHQKELKRHKKTIEVRLIRTGCAIGHLDSHHIHLLYERLFDGINFTDSTPQMLYKNRCLTVLTKMIIFTGTKTKHSDTEQKKADRILKNKKAFYPERLASATDLFLFLQTLELECKRIPHWDEVITFKDPAGISHKLYDFFSFINDPTIVASMNKCKWSFSKSLQEGCLTLYMSTWSSLSKSLQSEMSVFKDDIDFNGCKLLVKIINALRPEIAVLRTQAMNYITALNETLVKEKWDLLSIIPDLTYHVQTLINVGDSLDLVYTTIYGALSKCKNTHVNHDIIHWESTNKQVDSKCGKKTISFLKECLSFVHDAIRKNTWEFATPATYSKSKKKRKADDSDLALSSFQADKKTKTEDGKAKDKELKALRSELKQTKNTLSQVKANYANQSSQNTNRGGKPQPTLTTKSYGNYNAFDEVQYGENAFFKTPEDWMNFIRGTNIDRAQASKGFSVTNNQGQSQIWYWCKHCSRCGNHQDSKCKRANNPKKIHKKGGTKKAYPAPALIASPAIIGHQASADDDENDEQMKSTLGRSYSDSDGEVSD